MPKQGKNGICRTCYWYGQCCEAKGCGEYTPLDIDEYDDDFIDSFIDENRREFIREWIRYIADVINEVIY